MSFLDDLGHVMDVVEASIKHVCSEVAVRDCLALSSSPLRPLSPSPIPAQGSTQTLLRSSSSVKDRVNISKQAQISFLDNLIAQKWKRITYTQAVDLINEAFGPETIEWSQSISTEQERWIAEKVGKGLPVFVTEYPADVKPFYMRVIEPDESKIVGNAAQSDQTDETKESRSGSVSLGGRRTVACFDLLVPRIGELAGGSLREARLDRLMAAYGKHGLDPAQYAWYTDLRR